MQGNRRQGNNNQKPDTRLRLSSGLVVLLVAAIILGLAVLGLSVFLLGGCAAPATDHAAPQESSAGEESVNHQAKHVFVFLGDGMGINQVAVTRYYQKARDGVAADSPWQASFDTFSNIGLMSTHSKSQVTDSAAAITALLSGRKAENQTINYDSGLGTAYVPFARLAKEAGYAVGVVTSASVDHATPAGVYASAPNRYDYNSIAPQGLEPSYLDFLGGGGFRASEPQAMIALAQKNGFEIASSPKQIREIGAGSAPVLALAGGGINGYDMAYEMDRLRAANYGGGDLSFAELVDAAIRRLEGNDKFFLFCEAAKIDLACADQDLIGALYEVQGLDDGVAVALRFYEEHPEDTLIVVLADHETGGLRIRTSADFSKLTGQLATYDRFVSIMRKLYNQNAGFDAAMEKAAHYFSIKPDELDADTMDMLQEKYKRSLQGVDGLDPFSNALCDIIEGRAGVGFDTASHTGMPVPVYAKGIGAELFAGLYDNTDIYSSLTSIMGIVSPAVPVTTGIAPILGPPEGYKLSFSDEFDSEGLPGELWGGETGPWPHNKELQYYSKDNAFVKDGCLVIEARREKIEDRQYTSARLHTAGTLDMLYGYLEVRAAFPKGRGTWSAIWLLPSDNRYGGYLKSGEIDIAEHVGHEPNKIFATVHTENNNAVNKNAITKQLALLDDNAFHTYGLLWEKDKLCISVDGRALLTYTRPLDAASDVWPFDVPFHLILNLAIGGSWGGQEGVDDAAFPQQLLVDYVRYYQI